MQLCSVNYALEWCKRNLSFKEIGWKEHGEIFYRFTVIKTRWFSVFLHYADAPSSRCHDHPWHFWSLILARGYWENGFFQRPWTIRYRPARTCHLVVTDGPCWSLVLVSKKVREWGQFDSCE